MSDSVQILNLLKTAMANGVELRDEAFQSRIKDYKTFHQKFSHLSEGCYYPCCGSDFMPVFALPLSERFLYQDWGNFCAPGSTLPKIFKRNLNRLEKEGYIRGLRVEGIHHKPLYRFTFEALNIESQETQFMPKELILFYGKRWGDMKHCAPNGADQVDLVYTNGMHLSPYTLSIAKRGALIRSSTTIDSISPFDPLTIEEAVKTYDLEVLDQEYNLYRKR